MPQSSIENTLSSRILFEDNHLIVVNKLPSEIVQGDKTGDITFADDIKKYIKEKYDKPGEVFLGTVHRLDRPVSGIVLFARTGKALARMNELFRSREISKTYWAVTAQKPPAAAGTLIHYLIKNEEKNKSRAYPHEVKGSLRAELHYRLLGSIERYHLLEVNPLTGRHHQIRVQLATMGCVIKGDLKYGAPRSNADASIHLHARKLSFLHPVKKEPMEIIAPPPNEAVWNAFLNLPDLLL
jgi:23S rRNA pseudouridine1911/1915/1917 synthase